MSGERKSDPTQETTRDVEPSAAQVDADPAPAAATGGDDAAAPATADPADVAGPPRIVFGKPLTGVGTESNTRLLLVSVAVLCGVTTLAWGGAKVACNAHPPMYQPFKVAAAEEMTRTAKDAALEFHHALNTLEFDRARAVAKDSAVPLITAAQTACDAACTASKEARASGVQTRAIVLSASGASADVRVESHFAGQKIEDTYAVVRDGRKWFVEKRVN